MTQKLIILFLSLTLALGFFSCDSGSDSSATIENGAVQFSVSKTQVKSLLKTVNVTNITSVLVQIDGTNFSKQYNLALSNGTNEFISESISLSTGSYSVESFIVYRGDSAIYACPTASSVLASLVDTPLEISFEVKPSVTTKITPELLSVSSYKPTDFGYSTFSFSLVNSIDFQLSVFIYDQTTQNYKLTDAKLIITNGTTDLYNKDVVAKTNMISVSDKYDSYTITITKLGYKTYQKTLTKTELQASTNVPIEIHLE